jgi:Tol biopolymer transport system component
MRNPESGDFNPTSPAWSPDGSQLVYSTYNDQYENLCVVTPDSKKVDCLVADNSMLTGIGYISWKA